LRINEQGISVLKGFEKLRLVPYDDATGKDITDWSKVKGYATVGWGHKIRPSEKHLRKPITREMADKIQAGDVAEAERAVNAKVKVKLNDNQFSALVCFVFNVGGEVFSEDTCTLLRLLNQGSYDAVPAQLLRWNKTTIQGHKVESAGLTRRRWAERKLWLTDSAVTPVVPAESGKVTS
jgi:lysozyme